MESVNKSKVKDRLLKALISYLKVAKPSLIEIKVEAPLIVLQGIKYSAKLDLLNKLSFRASFVVNYDPLPSLLAAWLRASFEPLAISDYFPFVLRTPNEYE